MRIAVVGAGGVGGYFGGRLAQAGHDVTFIARGEHLKAMLQEGLRVESINGDFAVSPVQATDNPGEVGVVDLIVLGVKAWQISDTAARLGPMLGPDTLVLPLQNGLEASSQLAAVLGPAPVLGGLCAIYSFITEPGCIRHIGIDPSVTFGALQPRPGGSVGRGAGRTAAGRHHGQHRAGYPRAVVGEVSGAALGRCWCRVARARRGAAPVAAGSRHDRSGRSRSPGRCRGAGNRRAGGCPAAQQRVCWIACPPCATTSLQRDVMEGRPSELDAQAGALVRLGETGRRCHAAARLHLPQPAADGDAGARRNRRGKLKPVTGCSLLRMSRVASMILGNTSTAIDRTIIPISAKKYEWRKPG